MDNYALDKEIKVKDLYNKKYDREFKTSPEYESTLPDIQNQDFHSDAPIEWVGMAGIRRPLQILCKPNSASSNGKFKGQKNPEVQVVDAYIIGQVDCESDHRGINMSRLNRELADFDSKVFDLDELESILDKYCNKLERTTAMLSINFQWRQWQESLRTKQDSGDPQGGWQYYNITFDIVKTPLNTRKFITLDYIYSSHCPCSTELSEHAAYSRGVKASPHAQRSICRTKVELNEDGDMLWIEDLIEAHQRAVPSQVQIYVKRVDEQAFAELCAAEGTIFVEDAIRRFDKEIYESFVSLKSGSNESVKDYKIICLHAESLHPWGAHAVKLMGKKSKFEPWATVAEIKDMNRICAN